MNTKIDYTVVEKALQDPKGPEARALDATARAYEARLHAPQVAVADPLDTAKTEVRYWEQNNFTKFYVTSNTTTLDKLFEPNAPINGSLFRFEWEELAGILIDEAVKKGHFVALRPDEFNRGKSGDGIYIDQMVNVGYLVKELKDGAIVISPSLRMLYGLYKVDRNGKRITDEEIFRNAFDREKTNDPHTYNPN